MVYPKKEETKRKKDFRSARFISNKTAAQKSTQKQARQEKKNREETINKRGQNLLDEIVTRYVGSLL